MSSSTDVIDLASTDSTLRSELLQQPEGCRLTACMTCRTCSCGCPITEVDNRFDPARIIRMATYGLREEILAGDVLWLCSGCYTCQERCPQGVRVTDLIMLLKNMAVQAGHVPPGIRAQKELVTRKGRIYPLDDFDNKKRDKIGLPPLPTSCDSVKVLFLRPPGEPKPADPVP
ncbi:MAG: 4Fe-4S dicluster domain-containing protein [Deltaproteobacteria bacterium]|nr:4Fe-4S dicluster domain-containing protein [Deltaproteobacteria bacterium]